MVTSLSAYKTDFLLLKSIQAHSGAYLGYISMGTKTYSLGDKVAEA
jgi:hypothetical protein